MADEVNINILDESITIELQDKEDFVLELNEQGPQGATGPQGPQGPQGIKGDKGEPGRDGIDGEPGPANTLSIGTVVKGTVAQATITGESPNQTLNLVLPKGDKGDRGEVGPKGEQGIQGRPGDIGPRGLTGERGPEGKAATITIGDVYESDHPWVTNIGSKQDVILDFGLQKGIQGDVGPRGISVTGVEEISRQGLVSTYRMYFSNGEYFDYNVTDGSVSGITRDNIIQLLGFEPASYTAVEEINDLIPNEATTNNKLADKAWVLDNIPKEAEWGNITGNIENQLDLKEQLDSIYDTIGDEVEAIDAMLELKADKTQIEDVNNHLDAVELEVDTNTQRIEELTTARFPNVVIIGTPHIEGGQVSNYSDSSYLQFPFVDISRGQPFDIYFSFTTSSDVTTQQNILDSYFGIALAIQNGKGIMALSSNGTNWDIGTSTGTNTLLPNTTYYVKYSWTGAAYSAALSTNDETYVPDMNLTSSLSPHKTTIFIGGSPNLFGAGTAHPFKGTINFNKSKVIVNGITVWEGMADVGLASRANVSLNNLDDVGEARFNAKQDVGNYAEIDKSNKFTQPQTIKIHEMAQQTSALKVLSQDVGASNTWKGRLVAGSKNKTFLMGVYNNIPILGAHSWIDSDLETGANWEDIYINPDGAKSVYIGGNLNTANTGILKIQNNGSAKFKAYYNKGTIGAPDFKEIVTEKELDTKQDTLVSGTNIKTINGEDVLGSGDIEIKGSSYHPPLLSFMWSDHHSLDDMSWLEADTFSWQDGNVYKTVYDKLVEEFQTNPFFTTEGSITFKITRSGYKIAEPSQENAILSKYNRDRIAWYYILDIENKRFKLPRARYRHWLDVTLNKSSTLPVIGNGTTLGLTDTTSNYGLYSNSNTNNQWLGIKTGYGVAIGSSPSATTSDLLPNGKTLGISPNPNKSGLIADTSSLSLSKSVEEEDFYLYFYVGEYSQTAIEQTAGLNAEMFNNKADVENVYSKSEMNELLSNKEDSDTWVYHDYDSYSGYRYNRKNGYCEQYGRKVFTRTGTALTFFKEFKDTRYNITSTTVWQQNDYYASLTVSDMTTTGFTGHQYNGAGCYWKACGYLKEGTY